MEHSEEGKAPSKKTLGKLISVMKIVPVYVKFSLYTLYVFSSCCSITTYSGQVFLTELHTMKLFHLRTHSTSHILISGMFSAIMSLNISSEIFFLFSSYRSSRFSFFFFFPYFLIRGKFLLFYPPVH